MRLKSLFVAAVALASLAFAAPDAQAFGDREKPAGWGHTSHINHHVYYPRYVHTYKVDPYAYRYSPRGYYPFYGSGHWAKSAHIKQRNRAHFAGLNAEPPRYKFHKSWGYPRHWHHRQWHHENSGFIHRWHW